MSYCVLALKHNPNCRNYIINFHFMTISGNQDCQLTFTEISLTLHKVKICGKEIFWNQLT
jgi:hypothetical protein